MWLGLSLSSDALLFPASPLRPPPPTTLHFSLFPHLPHYQRLILCSWSLEGFEQDPALPGDALFSLGISALTVHQQRLWDWEKKKQVSLSSLFPSQVTRGASSSNRFISSNPHSGLMR